jgi:hypothetical protein
VIVLLNYITRSPQHIESTLAIAFYVAFLLLAVAVFVLPLTDINHLLREEKKRLLNRVNTQIEESFDKVRNDIRSNMLEQMSSLHLGIEIMLKEKALLESIPNWPWSPSTFRGFIAVVSSPVFIWLAQQLIDRLMVD